MYVPADMASIRDGLHMTPAHVAAFIGISTPAYWDIESSQDGEAVEILSVGEMLRLYAIFRVGGCLKDRAFSDGEGAARIVAAFTDKFGNVNVTAVIRAAMSTSTITVGDIGWEESAVVKWLSDDHSFLSMPCTALIDICSAVAISVDEISAVLSYAVGM